MSKPIVTITGVSGFIGSRICLDFLSHGAFKVRGTVRDRTNEKKIEPLRKAFGDDLFDQLELVDADLLAEESIISACEGSTYIVHTASPVMTSLKDERVAEEKMIKPAVNGTMAVMKAARIHKVKKVVITSSVAAIIAGREKSLFTEEDWSDLESTKGMNGLYFKSKTLAEKAAWDFVEGLPDDEKFEVATINPSVVMGPNITTGYSESLDLGIKIIMSKIPMYPKITLSVVDVRDVSRAHLEAVLRDEAGGNRFILAAGSPYMIDLANCLVEKYGEDYKMKPKEMNWLVCGFASLFDPSMKYPFRSWKKEVVYDGSKATRMLGIDYIKHDQMMLDMVPALIETGQIEDLRSNL